MTIELLVGIIAVAVIIWTFISARMAKYQKAHSVRESIVKELEVWRDTHRMTYGEIQNKRFAMVEYIKEKIPDDDMERKQLLNLIDEWADLMVQSFTDKRSWVRKPEKTP
ncbi:MAG: hypothetical protein ACE5D8_09225 [Fidelibacterota bacterium]